MSCTSRNCSPAVDVYVDQIPLALSCASLRMGVDSTWNVLEVAEGSAGHFVGENSTGGGNQRHRTIATAKPQSGADVSFGGFKRSTHLCLSAALSVIVACSRWPCVRCMRMRAAYLFLESGRRPLQAARIGGTNTLDCIHRTFDVGPDINCLDRHRRARVRQFSCSLIGFREYSCPAALYAIPYAPAECASQRIGTDNRPPKMSTITEYRYERFED